MFRSRQVNRIDNAVLMANRYTVKTLAILVIRQMQIKAAFRFPLLPVRVAVIQEAVNTCW